MAQYQHLPIYKSTYELLHAVTRATTGFPRDFKYSLGDKLRGEVVELVVFIFKANSSRTARAAHVAQILERLQVVELLVRPYARYLRRATVRNAHRQLEGMCRAGAPVADVRNTANSYFGILRQASAWRERSRIGDMLRGHGHIVALQNNRMFTERIPI